MGEGQSGKFFYARPSNSGPGMSVIVGLPYILGDKDPKDPENGWDKTWAFLKELGQYIEYYPTGTLFTLREFAQEQRWMIAGIMEWDMKPRAEAIVPPESRITILENTTFSIDGHYWAIPKGVPQNEIDIILDLMKFMLQPEQQALTWKAFIGPRVGMTGISPPPGEGGPRGPVRPGRAESRAHPRRRGKTTRTIAIPSSRTQTAQRLCTLCPFSGGHAKNPIILRFDRNPHPFRGTSTPIIHDLPPIHERMAPEWTWRNPGP